MKQALYRELLAAVNAAQLTNNPDYPVSWDVVTLRTASGEIIPVTQDTEEQILGMEISTPMEGYTSLWVIDGLGRYAAFPEVGLQSDIEDLGTSILTYNLPVVCSSAQELARLVILGE